MREGCSYTYPPLSIARYSFIQLNKLEQCRVKKLAQCFNTAAQDSNPGSLSRESEALPLSHCALLQPFSPRSHGRTCLSWCRGSVWPATSPAAEEGREHHRWRLEAGVAGPAHQGCCVRTPQVSALHSGR